MKAIIVCFAIVALTAVADSQDPFGRGEEDFSESHPGDVYLFTEKEYKGAGTRVHVKENYCVNFKEAWDDKAASIDVEVNTCVLAYKDRNCRGKEVIRLEKNGYGNNDLGQVRMLKEISSLQRC